MKNLDLKETTEKILESLPLEKQLGLESAKRMLIALEHDELETIILNLMAREEAYREKIKGLKEKLAQKAITKEPLTNVDREKMKIMGESPRC